MLYSNQTGGFYLEGFHVNVPGDVVSISDVDYQYLMAEQANGGVIAMGPSGFPEIKPTKWHTLNSDGDDWEITTENQALMEAELNGPTNEEIYDATVQNQKLLKAVVLSLNDGTFVPGANISNAALKAIIVAKM